MNKRMKRLAAKLFAAFLLMIQPMSLMNVAADPALSLFDLTGNEGTANDTEKAAERDVVLVLDQSGSMSGEPMEQTKEASLKFLDTVFERDSRVGIVGYESEAYVYSELTRDFATLEDGIDRIYDMGGTNMYDGITTGAALLENSNARKKSIILMSDGCPNEGPEGDDWDYGTPVIEYAQTLKDQGYDIYTLGFFCNLGSEEKIYAQQLMEKIASPGLHYEVNDADDIIYFFDDIASQVSGTRYVYIRIACPVHVTVSSGGEILSSDPESYNTRTSFGSLSFEEADHSDEEGGWESGSYQEPDQVKILRLNMKQDYKIEIDGYDTGTMDYSISYPDANGNYTDVRSFPGISVNASTKATSLTEKKDATILEVDENGDGRIDRRYKTKSNGVMKEVRSHLVLIVCLSVFGGLVLILISVLIAMASIKKGQGNGRGPSGLPPGPQGRGVILGLFGSFKGGRYYIVPGKGCSIGRRTSCDIVINHQHISRVHCVIYVTQQGQFMVRDQSSNGTYYNNQRLPTGSMVTIPSGAILALGGADNVIELRCYYSQ